MFASCFNRANNEAKKNLIVLLPLWSNDIDIETIEVFQNCQLGGNDKKNSSTSPNLLPNYLQIIYWENSRCN